MIVHRLVERSGLAVLTPEDVDDLWSLRRIISQGDLVRGQTSRIVKDAGPYARPDKGERIRVLITIRVERIRLDSTLERLRITGKIVDVSDDLLSKGSYHSLIASPGYRISIKKDHLGEKELRIIRESRASDQAFIVLAVDSREACIGVVRGTHLHIYPTIESGSAGKIYAQKRQSLSRFYSKIEEMLLSIRMERLKIFVIGPGTTKNILSNYLMRKSRELSKDLIILDGFDLAGQDGVYTSLKSPILRRAVEKSKLAVVMNVMEEALKRIARNDERIALSFKDSLEAGRAGAIEVCLVSDRIFELGVEEEDLMNFLDIVESYRGRIYLIDHSTDVGNQVSTLGGVVSLLRFAIHIS